MADIDFEKIEKSIRSIKQYHFSILNIPGVIYEGEIDIANNQQYIQIGFEPGIFPLAEIFWVGDTGFGRKIESNHWFKVRGDPLPNYLQFALQLLQKGNMISIKKEEAFWIIEIQPASIPIYDDPKKFYRRIFNELKGPKKKEFIERVIKLSQGTEFSTRIRISSEDYMISTISIQVKTQKFQSESITTFSKSQMEIIPPLFEELDIVDREIEIPMSMLLLDIPKIGGWSPQQRNHPPWATRSIQLIKDSEKRLLKEDKKYVEKYVEIYHHSWFSKPYYDEEAAKHGHPDYKKHHPIVLGADYEDSSEMPEFYDKWFTYDENYKKNKNYYFSHEKYYRDYHHYGGEDMGVKFEWYYYFRGYPGTTKPDDRYYCARDWGYGGSRINEYLNRLTFTQAIKQYNRYSKEGKRNAYLMLGHVIHLLQDVGQPDHARLVPHPGSGMNELEAYNRYHYCEILAAEAAAVACVACWVACVICAAGVFHTVLTVCKASTDKDEMGYEKLIAEKWTTDKKLKKIKDDVEKKIKKIGIQRRSNYNSYFKSMSDFSKNRADQLNLKSALGCGWLKMIPPIPYADPDIQSDDSKETKHYYELTKKIVPQIIGLSAGLIQHFYEIVNYPPYVERVAIVQWEPNKTPHKFAFFKKQKDHCVRYDTKWEKSNNKRVLKHNPKVKIQPLSLDNLAYIFILFGPTEIEPVKGGRVMKKTELRLVGTYPSNNKPIDIPVKLKIAYDSDTGYYYWGSFNPYNCGNKIYTLNLVIRGKDKSAHFSGRKPFGDEIDSNPSTIAKVDSSHYPYPLLYYEPGPDKTHKIKITKRLPKIFFIGD